MAGVLLDSRGDNLASRFCVCVCVCVFRFICLCGCVHGRLSNLRHSVRDVCQMFVLAVLLTNRSISFGYKGARVFLDFSSASRWKWPSSPPSFQLNHSLELGLFSSSWAHFEQLFAAAASKANLRNESAPFFSLLLLVCICWIIEENGPFFLFLCVNYVPECEQSSKQPAVKVVFPLGLCGHN